MSLRRYLLPFSCVALLIASAHAQPGDLKPPLAKKVAKVTEIHGEKLVDHFYWMREKKDPDVLKHLEAENAYAEAFMKPTVPLQEKLYQEFLSRIQQTDQTAPVRIGDWWYYTRTEEGKQYPIHCRKAGPNGLEMVLLDLNELAKGHKFYSIATRAVSDDGHLLAYMSDITGFRDYTLEIKDLRTGKQLPDKLTGVASFVWAADNQTLFYVTEDDAKRAYRLFRHKLGDAQAKDPLLYEEKDELFDIEVKNSRDRKYVFLEIFSYTSTEVRYLKRDQPAGKFEILLPREADHRYDADHKDGTFYIRTNKGAKNFRLVTASVATPGERFWEEVVPHRPEVLLDQVHVFASHLVLMERANGLDRVVVFDPAARKRTELVFEEPTFAIHSGENPEFGSTEFRFEFESFTTPKSVFTYDAATGKRTLLKTTPVPGGYDPTKYQSERIWVTAKDGIKVPVSIVSKKGAPRDGTAPLLLYGYGAYGIANPATFNESRFSLLDRGVTFAIAHIRGGGEMGEPWHDGGKVMTKRNSFTDFIACAEHLIDQKYTSKDRLAIQGRSAGGLLMGGVLTLRPDLPRVAVLEVPFLEAINTMLDETLPLTVPEFLEWGNPKVKKDYDYIKSYCPYTNLRETNYPSMLVLTSFYDSAVMYWEPAKYVAKLRTLKKDNNPLVFKCNMAAGHGGASGRYDALRERAFTYAFILTQLGVEKGK